MIKLVIMDNGYYILSVKHSPTSREDILAAVAEWIGRSGKYPQLLLAVGEDIEVIDARHD